MTVPTYASDNDIAQSTRLLTLWKRYVLQIFGQLNKNSCLFKSTRRKAVHLLGFSAFIFHCLFGVNQNTTVFEIVTALLVQNNLNENSTIQLIGEIGRDKPVQYLIPDSTVRTSLQSKRGRRGGAFNGEYIIVDIVTRIRCQQNLCKICLLVLMTLNNFRLVLCIATLEVTS